MPTANGSVQSTNGSELRCAFTVDGIERRFMGTVNPAVSQFQTSKATLTYDAASSLIGTQVFDGQLGVNDIQFSIGEGHYVSAAGTLTTPVRPAVNINGVGSWIISADD